MIQFTPPGSGYSVIFGKNVTAAAPGSAQGLYLIVSDIQNTRKELLDRGVAISEVFHDAGGVYAGTDEPYLFGRLRVSGPDPEHRSYRSFASFRDPDGNGWRSRKSLPGCPVASACDGHLRVGERSGERTSARRGRPRPAREAHRRCRSELAGLVCRVHGARAVRPRAAAMNDYA